MQRPRHASLLIIAGVLLALYVAPYVYYRYVKAPRSAMYFGSYVRTPWEHGIVHPATTHFTFDQPARAVLGSFAYSNLPYDAIGWLSVKTGWDNALAANILFYPLARLDHLFTGQYLHFEPSYGMDRLR